MLELPGIGLFRTWIDVAAFPAVSAVHHRREFRFDRFCSFMRDQQFRLRVQSRDHSQGDAHCPGCESVKNQQYPRPHRAFGTSCLGLVHAERVKDETEELKTVLVCDVCSANPDPSQSKS